jgi:uncharacterized protein YdhG (YjbR/CyaY superfamily)
MKKPTVKNTKPLSVDEYIGSFPKATQRLLGELRKVIKAAAPEAEEVISYSMPAYKQNGILVYFAGCKNHIGFYPTASGIVNFRKEIEKYTWSKGAIQFPISQKLPLGLIRQIVKFRVMEDSGRQNVRGCLYDCLIQTPGVLGLTEPTMEKLAN